MVGMGTVVSFLTRTPGMTSSEAREICQLHELVQESLSSGPIALMAKYAQIWRVRAESVDSVERNARRLVARLSSLGYRVVTAGDAHKLTLDFGVDEALRAELERSIDDAQAIRTAGDDFDEDEEGTDELQRISPESVASDHRLGMTIRLLARRHGITKDKVQSILQALRVSRQPEGRPPIERRRSVALIEEVFELARPREGESRKNGRTSKAARLLGCDRTTAWRFLKRYDEAKARLVERAQQRDTGRHGL